MSDPNSHIEIAFSSINVFLNDAQLDLDEFNYLLGLAMRDRVVDEDEKRVLGEIFRRAEKTRLSPLVQDRINEARRKHGIPA